VNWAMIVGGVVIAWIGGAMIVDGDTFLTRWVGLVLSTLVAGSLICIGCGIPQIAGWTELDSKTCAQYVYMDGNWACVPWEQGG
jgi:hypothetical protein